MGTKSRFNYNRKPVPILGNLSFAFFVIVDARRPDVPLCSAEERKRKTGKVPLYMYLFLQLRLLSRIVWRIFVLEGLSWKLHP